MTTPLLTTKLHVPRLRPERISRPRLVERLESGLSRPLTLISAPAGFGKTTLVAEWLASSRRPSAWLSLDEQDNDPTRFLAYLTAALRAIEDEAGQATMTTLTLAGPQASLPALMPQLVNEISAIPEEFILVLDDYHLLTSQPIHTGVGILVDHLPACMHLVLVTRADPPLPLARLRARGQLNELRQADLRLTPEEAADLLQQAMEGTLSSSQIEALNERTEGWIAGLQMAALALQERSTAPGFPPPDTDAFIEAFGGTQRHILDYLVAEVLGRQSEPVQSFLLRTSILDRLSGPLCDSVIGAPLAASEGEEDRAARPAAAAPASFSGKQMLEELERNNLFVTPLDDRREWYRYHRLFADLLRQRLQSAATAEGESSVTELNLRAARWFEAQGMLPEAIRHTLTAGEYLAASELIERAAPMAWRSGELATLQEWLDALPEAVTASRPLLSVYAAVILLLRSTSIDPVERLIRQITQQDQAGRLEGEVLLLRALVAMFQGDLQSGLAAAQAAVQRLPGESVFRGLALRTLSAIHLLAGDLAAAERLLEQDLTSGEATGDLLGLSASLRRLGSLALYRGELTKARSFYQRALDLSRDSSGRLWPMAGRILTHLGELALEQNRLEEAQDFITQAVEVLDLFVPGWNSGSYVLLARLRQALGDEAGAGQALAIARERAAGTTTSMDDVYLEVQAARLALAQHDRASAERWAAVLGSSAATARRQPGQEIETLVRSRIFNEIVQATLARLWLIRGQPDEALSVLDRLESEMPGSGEVGNRVEVQMLRALASSALGQTDQALADLEQALRLAEPEGFVRTFIDEGEPMASLLREAARRGVVTGYANRLLAALEESDRPRAAAPTGKAAPGLPTSVEPLTEREIEVLRLLRTALTTPEIAGELGIAPSTVRTFVKHLYGKLGVHRRIEAVDRAEELGLLRP